MPLSGSGDALALVFGGEVFSASASAAAVTNTTSETTILGTGIGSKDLAANSWYAGKTVLVEVWGVLSTDAVAHTLQLKVKLDAVVVLDTAAQTPTAALANRLFRVQAVVTCRTTGATGTVFGQGITTISTSASDAVLWDMENTTTSTVDTTQALTVDVTATWGAGVTTSDTITGTHCIIRTFG